MDSNKQTNQQQSQQASSQNSMQQTQQPINQPQFNELEIIPYEVQQQLAALAQAAHLRQYQPENLKEPLSGENSLMNYNKEYSHIKEKNKKHYDHFNKGNYHNLLRTLTIKPNYLKFCCFLILFIFLKLIFI